MKTVTLSLIVAIVPSAAARPSHPLRIDYPPMP